MKKIIAFLMIGGMLAFVACSQNNKSIAENSSQLENKK